MALLRYGYVTLPQAVEMVARMPIDDLSKRDMRACIRRWAWLLRERGYDLPEA
jgi:hypothetical protein